MESLMSIRRTDEYLIASLANTSIWTVYGRGGETLCCTASLRCALEQTIEFRGRRRTVIALARDDTNGVTVVFQDQIERLVAQLMERQ